MNIKWSSLVILVNFFCQLTNGQKDEKEETKNITNTDTATEETSIDKPISTVQSSSYYGFIHFEAIVVNQEPVHMVTRTPKSL